MRLRDLKAQFSRFAIEPAPKHLGRTLPDGSIQWGGFPSASFYDVDTRDVADSVTFLCPLCFERNGGPVGTHGIRIDFVGGKVTDEYCIHDSTGQPVRWSASGTSYDDLTLAPSIQVNSGCRWHGFIENGGVRNA